MLSFWILLLEQFLVLFLSFPGSQEQQCHLVCCVSCRHEGKKQGSREAAVLPATCHLWCWLALLMHAVLLSESKGKLSPSVTVPWLLKLPLRTVSKAGSKKQTINKALFLVGLFLKIISRLTQKEELVCL